MGKKQSPLDKMMNEIRKKTESTSYDNSKYNEISSFISTGCYALNSIVSGDFFGGIPQGKITTISGESASGKSLIASNIIINFLKNGGDVVFLFDSEGGSLRDFMLSNDVDESKIEHVLVRSVEDCTVKLLHVYNQIEQLKKDDPSLQFLCVLDSVGGLSSSKMISDALDKSKMVGDMGLRAKSLNNMFKSLMIPCLVTDTAFISLNHIYDDPAALYPSKIKNMPGGRGIVFSSQVIIQTSKKLEDDKDNKDAHFNGNRLKFFTTKNRIVMPFHSTEMFISFADGIAKYDGLVDLAKNFGYIEQHGAWYVIPSVDADKKYRMSQILSDDDIWDTFINDLNEDVKKSMQYGSKIGDNEIDKVNEVTSMDEDV